MSPLLGILDSGKYRTFAGNYVSIATATVTSGGASTITFSSIPSTYTHLQIRILGRGASATATNVVNIWINGDTASTY